MLSSRDQEKRNEPKKRSLLNTLFNPRVDRELTPLIETGAMFVRMLALIFASYNLFPKDHPAFSDNSLRLRLADVVSTAFGSLSFTRKGAVQVAVFFAVMGCLVFTALAIVTMLLSALVGTAHAQVFQTTLDRDWGIQWVNYLFNGTQMDTPNSTVAAPRGFDMQVALGAALSFYSTAVLALAGFLLIYHLAFMIAEQAQSGKIMGRANQIWAPIRLVFAIGMLVPIGTGGNTGTVVGYNTAQYLTIQTARWGSGLASNVWGNFVQRLNIGGSLEACTDTNNDERRSPSCINPQQDLKDLVWGLVALDACARMTNFYIDQSGINDATGGFYTPEGGYITGNAGTSGVVTLGRLLAGGNPLEPGTHYLSLSTESINNFGGTDLQKFCGGYHINEPPPATSPYRDVYLEQLEAFRDVADSVSDYMDDNYRDVIQSSGMYSNRTIDVRARAIQQIISQSEEDFVETVTDSLDDAAADAQGDLQDYLDNEKFTETGWLTAATYFNTITKLMAERSGSVYNAMPTIIEPSLAGMTLGERDPSVPRFDSQLYGVIDQARDAFDMFSKSAEAELNYNVGSNLAGTYVDQNDVGDGFDLKTLKAFLDAMNPFNLFLALIDRIGISMNLWSENGALAISFGDTANPLAEVAAWGQNNVMMGTRLMGLGMSAYVFSGAPGIGTAAGAFGSMLFSFAAIFYMIGFTFGFVIPLYPFYRFFFGSLQWILTVFEGVVLAPLFALAHVSPYGEGLPGQYAKYGYSVLLQILLRPVLMVFGLVAGYLLFVATIHFLNDTFITMTMGTGAYSGGNEVIAKIFYCVVYCVLVLILANQCFSTIGMFPQAAMKYLGLQGVQEERIGDTEKLSGLAAAYVGRELLTQRAPAMVKGPVDTATKMQNEKASVQVAKDRHEQLIETLQDR